MSISTMRLTFAAAGLMLAASASGANASYCGDGKTVTFAGIDWESGAFITEVMKTILSKGYDCQVDSIPGNSVTLEQATANNDVQIFAEEWLGRSDVWNKAVEEKKVIAVGKTFVGASEGWFVPDYVVHGDPARNIEAKAPDLKSVSQLTDPKIAEIFADPEEPSKGRFLNCPSGWTCEGVSTAKLEAYKLGETYVNFRPGTGTALDAAITSAYLQGEPILFYYWSPTAILGKFKLIQLEEPAYNEACWKELSSANGKRDEGCAFPSVDVAYGVNSTFASEAPEIVEILEKATFPLDEVNASLAYMADNKVDATAAAAEFLKTKGDIWSKWVSDEARGKIEAGLK
ncbi:ABC transporter substrate-binding protein [Sinorhizobium meliloti]|uniref:Histidine ABC transporter, periplasmic solute-binding protein n=4 Tax=Rhizobium meliloti TaxID=382 RepID=Q92MC6_RHIME|nr:ABC transporter substrate-binding protein [Sinorhizobium meliloti]PST23972.1 histidine ABC transporter substrate-binding protein [Mesorhizobium loti]TWA92392.1 glycine betaine/proline transport system substrate-binding protein [Ensifer sp. SEMIA 134]TWB26675.1 glycine betaine/proline transport system substrate-binding protein [Ensifer sp. SEMIA 135]AEG05428.1 ABC-type glycine betaine transport, periplasmic subunit [Sinorhizobium meliloti BL225C]AEG54462.1 ABC-type glycine betaine transport,